MYLQIAFTPHPLRIIIPLTLETFSAKPPFEPLLIRMKIEAIDFWMKTKLSRSLTETSIKVLLKPQKLNIGLTTITDSIKKTPFEGPFDKQTLD